MFETTVRLNIFTKLEILLFRLIFIIQNKMFNCLIFGCFSIILPMLIRIRKNPAMQIYRHIQTILFDLTFICIYMYNSA